MSTVGNTATPNGISYGEVATAGSQVAGLFTMPSPGGIITSVSAYAGSDGGTSGYVMVWGQGGSKLGHGAVTLTNGGAGWVTANMVTSFFVAGGTNIYIGWQSANGYYFAWDGTAGTTYTGYNAAVPGNLANGGTGSYLISAYATYTPAGANVWTGSAWTACPVSVWTGSQWANASVAVWNGTTWVYGA